MLGSAVVGFGLVLVLVSPVPVLASRPRLKKLKRSMFRLGRLMKLKLMLPTGKSSLSLAC
jgi:hypothetical protein